MAESSNRASTIAIIVILAIIAGIYFMNAKKHGTTVGNEAAQTMENGANAVAAGAETAANKTENAVGNATDGK